jgi:uncharacterized protein (DUF927 family)
MPTQNDLIDKILSSIDNTAFYQKHIPEFNANGRKEILCRCPFHEDSNPSLSVNVESGLFNCFSGCGGGNPIQFIQKLYNIPFNEAVERIKSEEGIVDTKTLAKARKELPKNPTSFLKYEQINTIHKQLINDKKLLMTFHNKYGLSDETIKKYLLGFQKEHFVIPIEIEPGKWTFKEHKGYQLKGAMVSLYPTDVIKEGLPIVITEGEFKALLLNQLGFLAVSGTGGANTWKPEWNTRFTGFNVILAFDNDEAGRRGAVKVTENLKGPAKSVKVIQWPHELDGGKDKKDVTDFFITLNKTPEDFQHLIDNAQETIQEIKDIGGIKFIEPEGYEIRENRIDKIVYIKDKPTKISICSTPLFITGYALDVDTRTEEVAIAFKQHRKWKSLWIPKRTISDMKKLIELSDHGLQVNSVNVKRMIEYLSSFEAHNIDLTEVSHIAKGVGWKTIRDRRVFILYKMISRIDKSVPDDKEISVEFIAEAGFERFVKALKPEGQYSKWRDCITKVLKYRYACFVFYASFAAPLLRILKAPNFIIDLWGSTSIGKTTVLELAASVWGNPHKEAGGLVFSWDSTKVFHERLAGFFCDIPVFPDDSQSADDRIVTSILYQVASGVGKGRGAITGIRHNPTWHTICFSTGERPLAQCTIFSGAQARTIELYGSPFPNAGGNFIGDLKQCIRENYGHAGPKFIEGLLCIIENPTELSNLKSEYKRYQQMLSNKAGSEIGDRLSQYFATVKIAMDLVCRILNIGDRADAEDTIFRVFDEVLKEAHAHSDIATRAMRYIISWVTANENFFKWSEKVEQYGRIVDGEYVGIFRHKFNEILKKEGYSDRAVLRGWHDRNWIIREDEHHFTCSRNIKGELPKKCS